MERRRLASFLPRAQAPDDAQLDEGQPSASQNAGLVPPRGAYTLMSPTTARHASPWKLLLLLGVACVGLVAIFRSSHLAMSPSRVSEDFSGSGADPSDASKPRSTRLKLRLSNLPENVETDVASMAALAAEERKVENEERKTNEDGSTPRGGESVGQAPEIKGGKGKNEMDDIFSRIADDIHTWAVRANQSPMQQLQKADTNYSSEESLAKQRKAALEVLDSSGLIQKGGAPDVPDFDHLERDRSRCPLRYDRIDYDDIRRGRYQPYLLGERAKPECNNCDVDHLWSHFCQFQTHGPVCPGWLKWQLASDWVKRAEEGSPGVKELLTLTPCDLFSYLQDRTLWLIGDSLTLEWDKAVKCFLFEFWDLELVHLKDKIPSLPDKFQGWCSYMAQGAKVCFIRANTGFELAEEVLPSLSLLGASPSDVMVLNFAVWQNRQGEYRRNITRFANYYAAHKSELPITIWRDAPVQHFDTSSGDYVWPVPTLNCKAVADVELLQDNSLRALLPSAQIVAEGGWRNKMALPVIEKLGIAIMNTWNQSLPMWQYHTNFSEQDGDCTHMCHPSEYQYWVFELYRTLRNIFPHIKTAA